MSLPCFLPTHGTKRPFPYQRLRLRAKCRYKKAKKKRLWQPKRLSVTWNSVLHLAHIVSSPGKKVSARQGPGSPLWWWGRRLTVVKGKDVAVGKRRKWSLWAERGRVSWDGRGLEKEHELWRKERLGAEGPWLGGIFRRLERGGSGVHRSACYPKAKSEALPLPLISSGCGGNVLCPHPGRRSTCPLLQAAICDFSWFYKATGLLHIAMSFLLTSTNTRK